MVVRLDSAQCNDGAEEHNGSVFRVTAVSGRQWCSVREENVSDEMVWSDLANHTKERWQKVMELSSTTGSGLWEGRLWNSQLKLAQDNPVPCSPYQCCNQPDCLKPPYITEIFFSCHITSSSMRTDSVTLKMEAVCSSEKMAGLTTTQYRNSKDGHHLLKCSCVAILILQVNVDPHCRYPVWTAVTTQIGSVWMEHCAVW